MIKEIDLGGVYLTPLLVWAIIALIINMLLGRLLARIGFYKFVWHRHLFDAAVFIILFAGITYFMAER